MNSETTRFVLLMSCQDTRGLISDITSCLLTHQANIVHMDQHITDPHDGMFFIRTEFDVEMLPHTYEELQQNLQSLAKRHGMEWKLSTYKKIKRAAVFVSKMDHCLLELIWRSKSKEIPVEIPMVISNHPNLKETVEAYGIPYYHIPVTPDQKKEAEEEALQLLEGNVDFIVLARYMQILTPSFISRYENRIINIHHSFLPAFIGANPYEKAFQRGVKLIGATAHYVTNDLDEGPIIQQDVLPVTHRYTSEDLKVAGRHVEKSVLAQAVSWHVEDKVIVHGNKTIVFS